MAPKNQLSAAEQQPAGVGVVVNGVKRHESKNEVRHTRGAFGVKFSGERVRIEVTRVFFSVVPRPVCAGARARSSSVNLARRGRREKPRGEKQVGHDGSQGPEDGHRGVDEPVRETAEHVGQPDYEDLSVQSRDRRVHGQDCK